MGHVNFFFALIAWVEQKARKTDKWSTIIVAYQKLTS